jgi:catechol 2,3-dioxygenase-like lactoylglutathione lyase family enzyme
LTTADPLVAFITSTNINLMMFEPQEEPTMSRVQLALNVADLDASIAFYTKLFGTGPAKIREGYANFAIADPPLKLILFTGMGEPGSLNHIGVEVEDVDAVGVMIARANELGMEQEIQENVSCCFAVQDKTWVKGPENDWEIYYVKGDAPEMACGIADSASGWSASTDPG